ncbi:MAG: hypothetical protein QXT43_02185 [Candidatus Micrarchaeaceae archaeon]
MQAAKIAYVVIGIIILLLLAYISFYYTKPRISSPVPLTTGYPVMAQLTDPPQVPNGTQSLNMSYAQLRFHVVGSNFSEWLTANESGKVDLLGLVNISKTLGLVSVPANSAVDELAFNITSLSIEINGTEYPVAVPNSTILIHLPRRINTSSSILADLSPTVVTIVTNSSVPVFVMVPSVRAVIIPGVSSSAKITGYASINATLHREFEDVAPNISITSANISSIGNVTTVRLVVKDNSNTSATLRNVLIFGNESMRIYFNLSRGLLPENDNMPVQDAAPAFGANGPGAYAPNALPAFFANNSTFGKGFVFVNGSVEFNESAVEALAREYADAAERHVPFNATSIQEMLKAITHNSSFSVPALEHLNESDVERFLNNTLISDKMEIEHEHFRVFNFLVSRNGTLVLPFNQEDALNDYYKGGYTLSPGGTATLAFSGRMTLGNSGVIMSFKSGNTYRIVVTGEDGARASLNVTAS